MDNKTNYEYLLSDLTALNGVGIKTTNLLKKKNINNIFDLLWKLPRAYTDRSLSTKVKDLKIGENQTVTIVANKYLFPRIRKLPNRVKCSDVKKPNILKMVVTITRLMPKIENT